MMPSEGFLQRWSRLKAEPVAPAPVEVVPAPPAAPVAEPQADVALPTLADAAALDAASDYSAFVGRGVDASVRRLAMKKLFADPHFNVKDGLDIYMGDYNIASPVSEAMLASMSHARNIFARIDDALTPDAADAASPLAGPPAAGEMPPLPPPDDDLSAASPALQADDQAEKLSL
ncbi:hypothetical protein CR105_05805 [Massilia eurypsychrophila]|jgi:hypothetical protein|uniref:DUF3306 domain-containing protein n=2 Tax=Massilia eurypsychrophila TaxID=1485217 RepID=A0A2G8THU5_9BURK|nr:hypothetical protein CR105_05805 [Massilia eurypsychrophila]